MVHKLCKEILASTTISLSHVNEDRDAFAYRVCNEDSEWMWGNWTNYSECVDILPKNELPSIPLVVSYILLIGSLLSLFFLCITFFIFCYFKNLQCSRLRVHQNLVVALVIHSVMLVVISLPVVGGDLVPSYREVTWLCRSVLSLKMYAALACINWMFNEGLLLHSRTAICVFQQDAPFKLYYFIGWGLPLILIVAWAASVSETLVTPCWEGYGESSFIWIITAPMLLALSVNFVFLINIIRVLVTRLRSREATHIRRAIKATVLLFPLLGITHLLFCVNPQDDATLEEAYMITNAVLQSLQGIFLAVLYCFMNSEVQTALRNAYLRAAVRRSATTSMRDRGFSNTSASYYDCSAACSPRHKRASAKGVHIHLSDLANTRFISKQVSRV
ncbi:corticotropin-releasing factor receptor 1-like [Limulus polyphemus]|uniref:Corticotropin-releasing factor receptor 1-like n=1 Tax=Limulus polyphemus TaxID=6850 RepID=A0ABM1B5I2_LIMPO|nr:corticotropin-releasing factor receptor 1-like [Limulus polyphemus]